MKRLLFAALLLTGTSLFAEGRFYIGGGWGYGPPAPVRVYAPPPPPPPYVYGYVRPYAPGPNHVWIDGYYDYYGRGYNWRPGYWAPRPHYRAQWYAPRYRGGRYYAGYWRR